MGKVDDKLKEIDWNMRHDYLSATPKHDGDYYIAQIKQVFKDEGYIKVNQSGKPIKHPVPCQGCGSDYWADWILLPHEVYNQTCPGGGGYYCFPCFAKRTLSQQRGQ